MLLVLRLGHLLSALLGFIVHELNVLGDVFDASSLDNSVSLELLRLLSQLQVLFLRRLSFLLIRGLDNLLLFVNLA